MSTLRKFIDIGANLNDLMFVGLYHGTRKHQSDLDDVLNRAWLIGLEMIMITGTSLEDSRNALAMAMAKSSDKLYCTVGCHPTHCNEFEESGDPAKYLQSLSELAKKGSNGTGLSKVLAIGECGLDYDRLEFCSKEIQIKYFEQQLELSKSLNLPLFLHCRNAFKDLHAILMKHKGELPGGVVHSFDGSLEDAQAFIRLGLYIGLNGCSLKTESNLEVVRHLPRNRIMLETDSPWCEVRPTHAGFPYIKTSFPTVKKEKWKQDCMVKGRNEPASIVQVLEIIAEVRKEDPDKLCSDIFSNTLALFFPNSGS